MTIVGTVDLHDNAEERTRFLETMWDRGNREDDEHRASWLKHMDTDDRLVGPIEVAKYITFDERKLAY